MPSEILPGEQAVHTRMSWRSAPALPADRTPEGRAQAERETAARLEQAQREGFAAGVTTARQEAEQKIRPALQNLAAAVAEIARMRDEIREEATADLVQLAVSMAEQVIHREVSVDPEALAALLKVAFLRVRTREVNRAGVHPGLEAMLRQCLAQCSAPADLVLIADPEVKPGDLLFETSNGMQIESMDADLSEIGRGLADKLEE